MYLSILKIHIIIYPECSRGYIMNVYYCKNCKEYFYISGYRYRRKCKICSCDLIKLPISFLEFVELDEREREEYIRSLEL